LFWEERMFLSDSGDRRRGKSCTKKRERREKVRGFPFHAQIS